MDARLSFGAKRRLPVQGFPTSSANSILSHLFLIFFLFSANLVLLFFCKLFYFLIESKIFTNLFANHSRKNCVDSCDNDDMIMIIFIQMIMIFYDLCD